MHTHYSFLITVQDMTASPNDIVAEVKSTFEQRYANKYCDDNNYYQELALVLIDGRVFQLVEDNNPRKLNKLFYHFEDLPQPERWVNALKLTVDFLAIDFRLFNLPPFNVPNVPLSEELLSERQSLTALSFEETIARLTDHIPKHVGGLLRNRGEEIQDSRFDPDDIGGITLAVEAYSCWLHTPYKPFTSQLQSPYTDYRAYDLRDYEQQRSEIGDNVCILFVDIHT